MITVMRGCNSVYKLGKIAVMEKNVQCYVCGSEKYNNSH